jgi:hypothetical protein
VADRRSRALFNDSHQDLLGPSLGGADHGQHHERE